MKYYHVTSKYNLKSIMKHGLVPRYGFLSELIFQKTSAVYLFLTLDEISYAMEHWMGDCITRVYNKEDLILLEINLPSDLAATLKVRYDWEAVSYQTISPEYISVSKIPVS